MFYVHEEEFKHPSIVYVKSIKQLIEISKSGELFIGYYFGHQRPNCEYDYLEVKRLIKL